MGRPVTWLVYATRADLEPGIRVAEADREIDYVRRGLFDEPRIERFTSAFDIPGWGCPTAMEVALAERFLILERRVESCLKVVPQRRGGVKYRVDEVPNPSAMIFVPGGVVRDGCILVTEILASSDQRSLRLFRYYAPRVTKGFRRVKMYRVGPEAYQKLTEGWRLTHAVGWSPEYDLSLDP